MSTALGKRKERDEDASHGSTLFVSNLPYTATSTDLQTLFSDIAPVRSAFVVTEPGSGVSKGVGYVSFAIKEDAESSFAKIAEEGISLVGRKLRVQWADSKPKEPREKGDAAATVKKEPKPRPPPRAHVPHDPLAIRTIIISGLPPAIDSKVLWKKIRKYEGAEKVDWPLKNTETGEEDPTTAHVLFTTPSSALDAIHKLHAHVYKGCLLSVTLKKRLDTLSKPSSTPSSISKSKKDAAAAPSHASRLIVRNIPFNATEQDLRAVFLPYGPIHSVHIPTSPKVVEEKEGENVTGTGKPRTKGFAFVWMLSRKDAEKAMEGCNGITIRAGTAETLVLDKQKRKKQRRIEMKMKAAGNGEEDEEMEEEEKEKEEVVVDDKRATERVIAVDWALSKDKWKEEKAKMTEDVDMEEEEEDDEESSSDEDSDSDECIEPDDSDDENSNSDSSHPTTDSDSDEEKPTKPTLPPPEAGTTLFIRNLPFSATDEDLRALFRTFGPLRYARIAIDPSSGRSRGTGFACFWNVEDADRVVSLCEEVRAQTSSSTSTTTTQKKKNPFVLPSILTPDPSSSLARSLVLHGRTLDVVRAVTRDVAGKLKEEGERMREKADKRNMYLLREGVIMPNTPSAQYLTPAEVEKRTSSFNARRALLKSNPSLFISKTRLSIRQIPIFVTERMLKKLSLHALKAFEEEVREGTRTGLTSDELVSEEPALHDDDEEAQQDASEQKKKEKKKGKKFTGTKSTPIKQTKIVRQLERVDPVTGKGRSKGYGFIEMQKHADALRLLRWANNNPEVGRLFEEWWADELEVLLKHASKQPAEGGRDEARIKRIKDEIDGVKSGEGEGGGKKRKAKGTLIVEFSIENVQVVQRRKAALERSLQTPESGTPHKKHEKLSTAVEKGEEEDEEDDEPSPKKRKLSEGDDQKKKGKKGKQNKEAKETISKPVNKLGSIIGRKRRERKGKKGSK